jgi:hypothetical protein
MPASCATPLPLGDLAVTNYSVDAAGDLCAEHLAGSCNKNGIDYDSEG